MICAIRLLILAVFPFTALCQSGTDSLHSPIRKKQLTTAAITSGVVYGGALTGLNHIWYKNSDRQSFRFFNDNAEWKQVDKIGHLYSSFHLSAGFSRGLQYYGVPESKADVTGAILGFAVLVPIEVFDGFSDAYGASVGDLVADAAGPLLYVGQKRLWNEIRLKPKFSYHHTKFASMRPELLGSGAERLIKDYNGQTYWLSVDMDKFIKFPRWLNLAIGYGAEGMVYARDEQHPPQGLRTPYRQYYLSLDFDASAIRTRSKVVRTFLFFVDMIKIPAPAVEFSRGDVRFRPLYF